MDLIEIGKYIKATRKSQGLKMSDLADEHISSSTISNIEKGREGVNDEKRVRLCQKLNLDYYKIPQLIQEEKNKKDRSLITLKYIEKVINLGNHKEGLQRLRKLNLHSDYLKAVGYYLRGRACVVRGDEKPKAKRYFMKSIQHVDQSGDIEDMMNIKASCYNQIAMIHYYSNDLESAVSYTKSGIDSFKKDGDKQYLIYSLLMNNVVYLDKLGYRDEATMILDDLWTQKHKIHHMDVLINMYDMQANFLIDSGMCTKAIKKAKEGLEIAQINRRYYRVAELLLTIGKAYMEMDDLEYAEEVFTVALDLESQVKQKHLFLPIYTHLGEIYMIKGEAEKASEILESAINEKSKNRDHHADRYVTAISTLAESLYQQGYRDKALNLYEKALELSQKHGLLVQGDNILFKMCIYYQETDEKKLHELLVKKLENELQLKQRKAGDKHDRRYRQ